MEQLKRVSDTTDTHPSESDNNHDLEISQRAEQLQAAANAAVSRAEVVELETRKLRRFLDSREVEFERIKSKVIFLLVLLSTRWQF